MPYTPRLELRTFDELSHAWRRGILGALVEAIILADRAFLRDHPETPPLYQAGVRYLFNRDTWLDIPSVLARGSGDCKDFVAWRCAELRRDGIMATPDVTVRTEDRPSGRITIYHVRVRFPNGMLEDPSRMLGMGSDPSAVY
jgi:hypothetical protein